MSHDKRASGEWSSYVYEDVFTKAHQILDGRMNALSKKINMLGESFDRLRSETKDSLVNLEKKDMALEKEIKKNRDGIDSLKEEIKQLRVQLQSQK